MAEIVPPRPAGSTDRRALLFGLMFGATATLAAAATPRTHETVLGRTRLEQVIPDRVGPWCRSPVGSLVLPETQDPDAVYDQVMARTFVAEGLPVVMLLIAYGAAQSGAMQVHRPETCYGSSGFQVRMDRPVDLALAPGIIVAAKGFDAVREDRREQVLYWTRISRDFPRDPLSQRLVMLRRGLQGVAPDGVLVRMSTFGGDLPAGLSALQAFARALVGEAAPMERALLIGAPMDGGGGRRGAA